MSISMKYLFVVAGAAGIFEALSAVWLNAPNMAGQITAGAFAIGLLGCAWAMWTRQSFVAASVIALLLLIDVAGVPFYTRTSAADTAIQLTFALIGVIGLVAWVQLLRNRRRHRIAQP